MSKFKVQKPFKQQDLEQEIKTQAFAKGAENHSTEELAPNAKPTRSFTVPMNDYEIEMLKVVAKKFDRSQRYISRQFLIKALKQELDLI